ncbi:MAG: multicopper oxidase domain-containing protein [Gammaproteobacteria bacterium]
MKLSYAIGVLLAAGLILWNVPAHFLPGDWLPYYYKWFGESAYREPPPNQKIKIPVLEIDEICPPDYDTWRLAQNIDGAEIAAVSDCVPDNPWDVAVSVRGANNVSDATLLESLFAPDAVEKSDDRDGDGDPDVIEIRLEVMELNGKSPDSLAVVPQFEIGPGITPGFWVFAPKTRGMTTINFESLLANRIVRLPAPVIRIEQGDEVRITLENTHYLPHTIHFHGLDHPFKTPEGGGNDGVPVFSEHPVMPGEARTYWVRPRHPGTTFYHCHVQPHSHILMGLQGMLVVEENRPNNWVQTFNVGAGRVRSPSVAVLEDHDREFDLHYLEIDSDLNNRIQQFNDPRLISRSIHREYNITDRNADYYVLNGRSFPYTLLDSMVVVEPEQKNRVRVLNGGGEGLALHFHGHKPTLTHRDGVPLPPGASIQRDVFWIASAQRVDLALSTVNDGLNAYGAGAWLLHDHREQAVTSNGIGPGGDVSMIVYEDYLGLRGLPQTVGGLQSLAPFFTQAYYAGEMPVFSGMHGHDLLDPEAPTMGDKKEWIFWTGLVLLAFLALLFSLGRWYRQ